MVAIIIGLIFILIIIVVVVNAIQQQKQKQEQEKRAKLAKQKAIIDENEELIVNLSNIPASPNLALILHRRSLTAAKEMKNLSPESKATSARVDELEARLNAAKDAAQSAGSRDEQFLLPDNEKQIIALLQLIKKLRVVLKSELNKGMVDPQIFSMEDKRLDSMQLKINIESLVKRGNQAYNNEMVGSARQYYEKALQTLNDHPVQSEYASQKQAEITEKLSEISSQLKSANAEDRKKRAKAEEDELDMLFQPKKKW
ncbi:hypothetical protein LP316_12745 [Thalassotalea sp. LPB0316]|uniref:hypothetical protein n=1 Tax=Thalassotalea sp. LPB0316 TaxID=2769490 RepID=UPI0018668D0F|nr:hypothetical protein [Thalassotalea sp. LPB0316]QOL25159.1 hypothetical protein LP316_12745 [Thalassotalea sp. LPB0316]